MIYNCLLYNAKKYYWPFYDTVFLCMMTSKHWHIDDRENVYFILLSSSNRKYESLTIV